jgi:hypothetical protein
VEKHGEHKDRRGKQKKSSAYAPARSLRFVNSVPSVLFALRLARNRQNPGSEKHGEHKDHRGKQKKSSASAPARSLRFVNSVPSVFVRASAGSVTIRTPVGKTRRTQRQQRKTKEIVSLRSGPFPSLCELRALCVCSGFGWQRNHQNSGSDKHGKHKDRRGKTKEIVSLRSGPFPSLCELRALCVCSGFGWQRNHQNSGRTNTENTKTAEEKQKKSSAFAPARSLRFVNSVPSVFVRASAGSVTIRTPVGQTRKTQRPQRKKQKKSSAFAPARSLRFVNSVPSVFVRASAGSVTIRTPVGQTRKTQRPQRKNKRNRQPSLRPVPFAS